jgi:uncharacterized protein with HEPN domain
MPQRDPGVYLEDIEYYADAAIRFIATYSLEQYLADEKTRAAVERVLEICGEAMNGSYKVAPAVPNRRRRPTSSVPWRRWSARIVRRTRAERKFEDEP